MPTVPGRTLVTGPSGSGKSTLAIYLRTQGVHAVDGDEVRGLGRAVDLSGRPLRRISGDRWRRADDWQFFWHEPTLTRFLARRSAGVVLGAADNLFDLDLASIFDRRIYLRAPWSVIRARLNSPTRDNDWGRDGQPAQQARVRSNVREWPRRARAHGFEFVDARLPPAGVLERLRG